MRIHVPSLPHTHLTEAYQYCAFSMKIYRFPKILRRVDIDCIVYGPDVVDKYVTDQCLEYVSIVGSEDRTKWFGKAEWDRNEMFNHWDPQEDCWREMNSRAAKEIRKRWQPGDVLGIIAGRAQQQIVDELSDLSPLVCEWGIGYEGVLASSHKVAESYSWLHYLAGKYGNDDIRFFDGVVPNVYDIEEFTPNYNVPKDPYLLFMARPIRRKGTDILREIVKYSDIPVKIAGQPGPETDIPGIEHVGIVTGKEKAELIANATAFLGLSLYLEPYQGSVVESMISGTPAIVTDWGGQTETVVHGVTGFRCRMLKDFLQAIEKAPSLNRRTISYHGEMNFTIPQGATLYKQYFDKLNTLFQDGWYQL